MAWTVRSFFPNFGPRPLNVRDRTKIAVWPLRLEEFTIHGGKSREYDGVSSGDRDRYNKLHGSFIVRGGKNKIKTRLITFNRPAKALLSDDRLNHFRTLYNRVIVLPTRDGGRADDRKNNRTFYWATGGRFRSTKYVVGLRASGT